MPNVNARAKYAPGYLMLPAACRGGFYIVI